MHMQRAPQVLSSHRSGASVAIQLLIPVDLIHFHGHFAELPLLPGVVQVDWAIRFGREHFDLPADFQRLSALKFMRVIRPGAMLDLRLELAAPGELRFRYLEGAQTCSSGRLFFRGGA
ncbi:MAG: hypothetical protein ACRESS_10395 [Stenotrophobium sp.]